MEPEAAISRFAGPLDEGHALLVLVAYTSAEGAGLQTEGCLVGIHKRINIASIQANRRRDVDELLLEGNEV